MSTASKQQEFSNKAHILATKVDTLHDMQTLDPVYTILALFVTHQAAEAALKATCLRLGVTTLRNCGRITFYNALEAIWLKHNELAPDEHDSLFDLNKERNRLQHDSILLPSVSTIDIICNCLQVIRALLNRMSTDIAEIDVVVGNLGCP